MKVTGWKQGLTTGLFLIVLIGAVTLSASSARASVRLAVPQSVHASAGNGFATVSWLRPKSDGGHAITRYVVTSHPVQASCTTSAQATACTLWELANGTSYTFTVSAMNMMGLGPSSVPSNTVTPRATLRVLPTCNDNTILPTKPVAPVIVTIVTKYYAARHLAPITIFQNQETVLSVHENAVGMDYCKNVGDGIGATGGYVPVNAVAAVRVLVEHKTDSLGYSAHFLTIAEIPKVGWKVVGVGTGP